VRGFNEGRYCRNEDRQLESQRAHRRRVLVYYITATVCFVFLALPLLSFDLPPLVDYPNHLARVHILANYRADPHLLQTYRLFLEPIPNLAMDIVATPLAWLFGTFVASKLFLVGMLLTYCCGCHALGYVGLGRPNWIAIPCFFLFYNSGFLWGFVNYIAGVAVFFLALAWWLSILDRPRGWRWACAAILALLCYLCHLTSYGFLGVAASVVVGLRLWRRTMGFRQALIALVCLAPPAFVHLYVNLVAERGDVLRLDWPSLYQRAARLLYPIRAYDVTIDLASFFLLALVAAAASWWLRPVRLEQQFGAVGFVLFVFFLAAPDGVYLQSGLGLDQRFVVPYVVLLLLGLRFPAGNPSKAVLLGAFVIIFVVRVGFIWGYWERFQVDLEAANNVIARLPLQRPACVVHTIRDDIDERKHDLVLSHSYCLAVILRGAVIPRLFTQPGAQPIDFRVAPPTLARANQPLSAEDFLGPALWGYCESFVTYREPPDITAALQGRAELDFEAGPFRLWRNLSTRGERAP
jgi:hypothetical protein